MNQLKTKSPWNLLPLPAPPSEHDPSIEEPDYFYRNVVKPLIPDFIRVMNNFLTLDWKAVDELAIVIDNVLDTVSSTLGKNQLILDFQEYQYPIKFKEYEVEVSKSMRTIEYYTKEYKESNATHRAYVVNTILSHIGLKAMQKDKWTVKDIKSLHAYSGDPMIAKVINKQYTIDEPIVLEAMLKLATDKMAIWNKVRTDKIEAITKDELIPPMNPGSSKQKTEFFEFMKIEPLAFSKTSGEPSWGRDQIEELFYTADTDELKEVLQMFIDYSFSAIIKNNFLESFSAFAQGDKLYGNIKIFGAKSFRITGNSPNFTQLPSTGSIYAKPLKKCLTVPKGYVVYTADLNALEDKVIANLSGDVNKLSIFTEGLDGHSLNACGYFPERLEPILGKNTNNVEYVKSFMKGVAGGNKELKSIRQESKGPTFALSYGAYPPKIASSIKCSLEAATTIFDNYHNKLYPGISKYREEYVLPTVKEQGYIHLGLGCRLYASDADKSIRTLNNATVQFWSILTLLAINKLHSLIDEAGYQDDIKITATIYDSIYLQVKEDSKVIKWLNDNLIPLMTVDILKDTKVSNSAEGELGRNWGDLHSLTNKASIEEINDVLSKL